MIKGTEQRQYELAPEGQFTIQLKKIIDQPQVTTQYGPKDKLLFVYEVVGEIGKDGQTLTIAQSYYNGLGTKLKPSKLRKDTEKLLGRRLTDAECKDGFDEQTLIGITALAEIVHNTVDGGRTYANIDELYSNRHAKKPTPLQPPQTEEGAFEDEEVPF